MKSAIPIAAARAGAPRRASRLDHQNQKAASRTQGTHKRLDRERLSANPSSQADCPANPLMARKRDSSQPMEVTIKCHPSFVNRQVQKRSVLSISFLWSIWLSGMG